MLTKLALAMIPLLALSACKAPDPDAGAEAVSSAPVGEASPTAEAPRVGKADWDFSSLPAADASLEIALTPTDFCAGSLQAVTLRWDVSRSYRTPQIWVQTGTTPKLFAALRAQTGEEPTGPWVRESTTFFLVDGATSKVLQQVNPTPATCD